MSLRETYFIPLEFAGDMLDLQIRFSEGACSCVHCLSETCFAKSYLVFLVADIAWVWLHSMPTKRLSVYIARILRYYHGLFSKGLAQ